MKRKSLVNITIAMFACMLTCNLLATEPTNTSVVVAPIFERFSPDARGQLKTTETPSFQKHVSPLLGRLGCNGRSCHGSFQGQGGFRLSLFGYDFQADYDALLEKGHDRVNHEKPVDSLILSKPIDADNHEGGKRFDLNSWEYWVLRRWIESGDTYDAQKIQRIQSLDVTPKELRFTDKGQSVGLKVVAHWEDGSVEDVTSLCRFQSNDSAVASIDVKGVVTSGERGDTHVVVSYDNAVVPILAMRPMSDQIDEKFPPVDAPTTIDRLVTEKLRKMGIVPSAISTDEEFLRRVSLDMTGTLPTSTEVIAFCSDTDPAKRTKKIEELLTRPGYVAQWTTFLCDMTGNNDDQLRNFFPQGIDPSSQWYRWIYERVEQNMPYDELVEGIVTAVSRLPKESYREYCEAMTQACKDTTGEKFAERPGLVHFWARNNFKTTEDRVIGFAYSFLGVRIQCAQCHKHPFDQWAKSDFDNFERLFGGVQANQNTMASDAKKTYTALIDELKVDKSLKGNQLRKAIGEMMKTDTENRVFPFPELVVDSKVKGKKNKAKEKEPVATKAKLLGGDWIELDSKDVRGKLMDWLRSESNPYFAKAIVNRVWAAYFGVGIVNPPDDLNLANAPSNAPLLDYLANGFREHQFDMKWLHREIVNSNTYQRSWVANETNEFDKRNFSHSLLRRLPAEATHDAVRMALINDKLVESAQRLEVNRAITRGGASSQAPRDDMTYALSVFGRSIRESNCDCDRSTEPSLLQTVFLLNDKSVLSWLNDPKESWVASVADKYDWPAPRAQANAGNEKRNEMAGRLPEQLAKLQKQLEKAESKLAEAQASGKEQLVETLKQRKEQALKQKERLESLIANPEKVAARSKLEQENVGKAKESDRMTEEQALWVTEQAYLRALSRKPKPNEIQVSTGYLRTESNPTIATENLIWSLLNTKEFIINH